MPDFIPRQDAEFNTWQDNFINNLNANKADFSLTNADIEALTETQASWTTAYAANVAAKAAAEGAQQAKRKSRDVYESALRSMAKRVQSSGGTTDKHRAQLGLNIQGGTHTAAGVPETRPVVQVDTSQRLRHTISFSDESTPNSRAKPAGVMGCEIWSKIGDPAPSDPSQLHFMGLDTSTPYMVQFGGEDAGKTAYYMLR
ncbi:MAG TPA: hypothetical protein VGO91_07380, partial [Pyrinomonadaceae bacterium]|nr:hypothetical protein [Pyrinomonadaceae bacterium]